MQLPVRAGRADQALSVRIREWFRLGPAVPLRRVAVAVPAVPELVVPAAAVARVVVAGTTAAVAALLGLPAVQPAAADSVAGPVAAAGVAAVAAEPQVPSVAPAAAVRFVAANPRSSAVKSSTTCRPRRWAA
ncbi:hypothetical protein BH24ACT9_BH24ACT9_00210 [soil metagenome]